MSILTREEIEKMYSNSTLYQPCLKDNDPKITTDSSICEACGGKCCKICGCHYSPDDFTDLSFDGLKRTLDQGYISIDIIYGEQFDIEGNYLILRIRNKEGSVYDTGYRSDEEGCSLLTKKGCLLSYEERPSGGKLLIPSRNHHCQQKYDIVKCALEWRHFQRVLHQLSGYYQVHEHQHIIENQLVKRRALI